MFLNEEEKLKMNYISNFENFLTTSENKVKIGKSFYSLLPFFSGWFSSTNIW